jgi:hypothetical protein
MTPALNLFPLSMTLALNLFAVNDAGVKFVSVVNNSAVNDAGAKLVSVVNEGGGKFVFAVNDVGS